MPDFRCLCLDVDGVLTDGRLFVDESGLGIRAFHALDGFAIEWFRKLGGEVVIISGKASPALDARARQLRIEHVIQGSRDKLTDIQPLLSHLGLRLDQVVMVGDDLPDLPIMTRCGYPIAVANAVEEVKTAARFVTQRPGGQGAVREAVEHVLRGDGRWQQVLEHYGAGAPRPARG